MKRRVLIVDPDDAAREALAREVERAGFDASTARDVFSAQAHAREIAFDALVVELKLPGGGGISLIRAIRRLESGRALVPVLALTASGSISDTVAAMRLGVIDVLEKPAPSAEIVRVLREALHERAPRACTIAASPEPPALLGDSSAIDEVRRRLEQAARASDAPVLIEGETGVGKELAARGLHALGGRGDRPFVAVNCAALTETLLEAELFGYDSGAFTGALRQGKVGLFEEAKDGTLLLDEVGELPLGLQAKLLRALEERAVRRVGGSEVLAIDARVVAATNRDLRRAVEAGAFRRDLFHRLAVVTVRIPPLRERPEDARLLALHFVETIGKLRVPPVKEIEPLALESITRHAWPGNVRELRNAIQRAVLFGRGDRLTLDDLEMASDDSTALSPEPRPQSSLREMEADHIRAILERTRGNVSRAATILGIHRSTLYEKLRAYGIAIAARRVGEAVASEVSA